MSEQSIYLRLRRAGLGAPGACALMGNMRAESAMKSRNVQDGMGYSDEDYTTAVDAGLIDFVADGRGYGLCQWTYGARKRNLLDFARRRGVSVGDEDMQVDFCIEELRTGYPALWLYLCSCKGVYEAAGRVCTEYERPAVNNTDIRAGYANEFYMRFAGMEITQEQLEQESNALLMDCGWPPRELEYGMTGADVVILQALLLAHGYNAGAVDGIMGNRTTNALIAYQTETTGEGDGQCTMATWRNLTKL